jgi:hypothetical protein
MYKTLKIEHLKKFNELLPTIIRCNTLFCVCPQSIVCVVTLAAKKLIFRSKCLDFQKTCTNSLTSNVIHYSFRRHPIKSFALLKRCKSNVLSLTFSYHRIKNSGAFPAGTILQHCTTRQYFQPPGRLSGMKS